MQEQKRPKVCTVVMDRMNEGVWMDVFDVAFTWVVREMGQGAGPGLFASIDGFREVKEI